MRGVYNNFPQTIHLIESFSSTLSIKQLQQNFIQTLKDINRKPFHFEEIAIPTIPNSEVIFEFGLAEDNEFSFINEEIIEKALEALNVKSMQTLDFFCVIRYYKVSVEKKKALKFDYYMLRSNFAARIVEFQVFHKQGPRYISPEDLIVLIVQRINERLQPKNALKKSEPF